jgi:hypothetical protein
MKKLAILFALLGVVGAANAAVLTHGSVGHGHGVQVPGADTNCGTLMLNYDGSAENGYCWQYGGIVPPYYGAFAECYSANSQVSGIELLLTGVGYPCAPSDLYVWGDAAGMPGTVLQIVNAVNPCPVATWPNISTHDFCFTGPVVNGNFWVGYWGGNFGSAPCGYFIAADQNGFGGCPMTNIAPGIGYPTGWNNASIVWGATQALGIGAWVGTPPPNPVKDATWGSIKHLYN